MAEPPRPGWVPAASVGDRLPLGDGREAMHHPSANPEGVRLLGHDPRLHDAADALRLDEDGRALAELAGRHAAAEPWGTGAKPLEWLEHYLAVRLQLAANQGRAVQCFDHCGVPCFAAFDTGLISYDLGEPVVAVLARRAAPGPPWRLLGTCAARMVCDPGAPWNAVECLVRPPGPAAATRDPADMVFASNDGIDVGDVAVPPEAEFLPPALRASHGADDAARMHALERAAAKAARACAYDPRLCVPIWRAGGVQCALPVHFGFGHAVAGLVCSVARTRRGDRAYRACAVVDVLDAYKLARAAMPVSAPWLVQAAMAMAMQPAPAQMHVQMPLQGAPPPQEPPKASYAAAALHSAKPPVVSAHAEPKAAPPPKPPPQRPDASELQRVPQREQEPAPAPEARAPAPVPPVEPAHDDGGDSDWDEDDSGSARTNPTVVLERLPQALLAALPASKGDVERHCASVLARFGQVRAVALRAGASGCRVVASFASWSDEETRDQLATGATVRLGGFFGDEEAALTACSDPAP